MKRFALALVLSILAGSSDVHASEEFAGVPVGQILRETFPNLAVDAIHATPVTGLFEVVTGGNVLYFAPATGHLLFGELWSKDGVNLTAERKRQLLAEKLAHLPLGRAVKIGDGPAVVIEITDPDCPFCGLGSDYLNTRSDITRYVFFFPLPNHPKARAKAAFVLAAESPPAAYQAVMSGRYDTEPLPEFAPTGQLEEHIRIVEQLGIRGTPHYWIGGEHVAGADLDAIRNLLP